MDEKLAISTITKLFGSLAAFIVVFLLLMVFGIENGISSTGFFAVLAASLAIFTALFYAIYKVSKPKRLMFRLD